MVLLLLTFFLLSSSMVMQSGIRVQPPTSTSLLEPMPKSLVVTLSAGRDPQIYFQDKPLTLAELGEALDKKKSRSRQVLVRADELAAFGEVVRVSQLALDHGFEVIYATTPVENPAQP